MQISLDGFVAGPNGELDWMVWDWDEVLINYTCQLTDSADTFLMGRATGEGMAVYWPTVPGNPQSKEEDKWMAERLNHFPKIVFSKTVTSINWTNVRVANDIVEAVHELKKEPGKDIVLYGGAGIVSSFIKENLIDEYHLYVNPVAIGRGKPIFTRVDGKMNLKLINTTVGRTGIIILHYEPVRKRTTFVTSKNATCESLN